MESVGDNPLRDIKEKGKVVTSSYTPFKNLILGLLKVPYLRTILSI